MTIILCTRWAWEGLFSTLIFPDFILNESDVLLNKVSIMQECYALIVALSVASFFTDTRPHTHTLLLFRGDLFNSADLESKTSHCPISVDATLHAQGFICKSI